MSLAVSKKKRRCTAQHKIAYLPDVGCYRKSEVEEINRNFSQSYAAKKTIINCISTLPLYVLPLYVFQNWSFDKDAALYEASARSPLALLLLEVIVLFDSVTVNVQVSLSQLLYSLSLYTSGSPGLAGLAALASL
jgi:hypothetical protein